MIKARAYWKDILDSFRSSKGRVFSIILLMALGSFALVGLKVVAPDMRLTGEKFFQSHNTADLYVISDYGLDSDDRKILSGIKDDATIEYGYFKDVVIKGKDTSFRIFSKPKKLSTYDVVEGKLPTNTNEIAISAAYQDKYKIGDKISFSEKENTNGKKVLKETTFTITGFVNSSEILSRVNQGPSTSGSGELSGYAVVTEETFDSDVYMIARIAYKNLKGLSPYSEEYSDKLQDYKSKVQELFKNRGEERLTTIKVDGQKIIDDGNDKILESKEKLADAKKQLDDAKDKIIEGEKQLALGKSEIDANKNKLQSAQEQLKTGKSQLDSANKDLKSGREQLNSGWNKLADYETRLKKGYSQILSAEVILSSNKVVLDAAKAQIDSASKMIDIKERELVNAKSSLDDENEELVQAEKNLNKARQQIQAGQEELSQKKMNLEALIAQLQTNGIDPVTDPTVIAAKADIMQKENELASAESQIDAQSNLYQSAKIVYDSKYSEYEAGVQALQVAKDNLKSKTEQYEAGLSAYNSALSTLMNKKAEYESGLTQYQSAYKLLSSKENQYQNSLSAYEDGLAQYNEKLAAYQQGQVKLENAISTLLSKSKELDAAKKKYAEKTADYNEKSEKAFKELSDKEDKLAEAQETLNHLSKPTYNVYTRREAPGSEGYLAYENQTKIIDSIANIFPVVLYLIAALVTFTTMGRFVDEERLKVGAFRALGYERKDVILKFLIYGATCGILGTIIGTLLGHYLLPMIVYKAYSKNLIVAAIELPFYWKEALYALILSSIATVLPAYIVARQMLAEKPAELLLPKAPVSGTKILLERITPLWNRMSFTQKVTARNIFRYKKRMFMTIFGVAGSVAMVFTGLGVHGSIEDLSTRQFSKIITYDMVVVDKDYISNKEKAELDDLLNSKKIEQSMAIRYDKVTKVAGNNNDEQSITLISIDSNKNNQLKNYIHLKDQKSGNNIDIPSRGAVISKKLADLLGVKVGDTIVVKDEFDEDVTLTISDVSEMYMNHFIFISDGYYKEIFGKTAEKNAHLINLVDDSDDNASKVASDFMNLNSTKGLVQNISLKHQISTIVNSLNNVMLVLVVVSILLATVILYNLTNINVAERIRELSTIKVLGFHNKEVTMYIYRESIYLSLIGILVGFGSGYLLYRYMLYVIPPDFIVFNPAVKWIVYAFPTVVIVLTLFILGLMVNHWLKKVDMLEALKSVE